MSVQTKLDALIKACKDQGDLNRVKLDCECQGNNHVCELKPAGVDFWCMVNKLQDMRMDFSHILEETS